MQDLFNKSEYLLINSNSLTIPLADNSVNCVVTSPPYYGLRDYGTAKWEGGDAECKHQYQKGGRNPETAMKQLSNTGTLFSQYEKVCKICGAVRVDAQLGLEQTPDEYVANMVAVFREVRRVLRDDGVAWLNLGDSYAGNMSRASNGGRAGFGVPREGVFDRVPDGLKPKDLIGIPWRVALALQADGWWLRQDIIWSKPNPMPESVKDRCTKAHEYIFLLTKSARYYYDAEAVKIPSKEPNDNRGERGNRKRFPTDKIAGIRGPGVYPMANRRSVWTITTKPYKGAHYATFPPDLITPCILAGCPQTVCAKCGAPYERVQEREDKRHWSERQNYRSGDKYSFQYSENKQPNEVGRNDAPASYVAPRMIDLGFQPTCSCNAGTSYGIVLDPFVGSGTTVMVANKYERHGIGIDLSLDYLTKHAKARVNGHNQDS